MIVFYNTATLLRITIPCGFFVVPWCALPRQGGRNTSPWDKST